MFDAGVTEALLSLSTITKIENLLPSLMKILHHHLQVEKSILILPTATQERENLEGSQLKIASIVGATLAIATYQNNSFTFQLQESIFLADYAELPWSSIHQVELTHETIVINDCHRRFRFSRDNYFVRYKPRNLLCLPLIEDFQLVGIFYLENSLNPEGFTTNNLKTIKQIVTQATASLFNLETNIYQLDYAQNLERQIEHLDSQLYATVIEQHQAESKLFQRERYLSALVEVQQHLLLASELTQVNYAEILKILGQVADASRAYIFQNHYNLNGDLLMSQIDEWCATEIESKRDNLSVEDLSYNDRFSRWYDLLAKDEIITGIVKDFPKAEREILEPQNILAILILPIIVKQKFWGFIGFDNCLAAQKWQDAEINLLRAATSAIVFWLERQETQAILNRDRALLKGQQEAALDGILAIDECRQIASYNQRFCQLWNIPANIVSAYNSRQLTNFLIAQLVDPEEFLERIDYSGRHLSQTDRDEILLKDGRIFDYYAAPIKSDLGQDYGKIWYFRDITEARNREKFLSLIVETTASQIGSDFFYSCVKYCAEIFKVKYAFLAEPIDVTARQARTLSFWYGDRFVENFQYCLDGTPCQQLITKKQGKFLYSVKQPFPTNTFLGSLKIQSYLGMPIYDASGHNILGYLVLIDSQPLATLTEQQELILKIFLTRIGVELERRKAKHALEKQIKRALLLEKLTQEIRQSLDTQQIFQTAARQIGSAFGVSRCQIHLYGDRQNPTIPVVAEYIAEGTPFPVSGWEIAAENNPYLQKVIHQYSPVAVDNIHTEPLLEGDISSLAQLGIKSILAVQTSYQGKINGVIILLQGDRCCQWQPEAIELLEAVAGQVGIALAQGRLLEQEKQQRQELSLKNLALEKARVQSEVANRAKSQFLAQMSHELRTPLNAILGFTEILTDETLDDAQQKYLEIINKSGKHLLNLINDVLDMSKIEAGQVSLEFKGLNLTDFLNDLHEMFILPAQTKGLQLITQTSSDIPQNIVTDENKLRQVLINLLNNAIKFTKQGTVSLTVTCNAECLFFQVRDTGSGIAARELKLLFQPFIQTEAGRKSGEGTGLGLSITNNFVRLLGGEIRVDSELGVGTTFSFELPLNVSSPLSVNSSESRSPIISISDTTDTVTGLAYGQPEYRILVVDDNPANRTLLLQLLTKIGFTVREAEHGKQAVQLASTWQPHLIWMDLQMPVVDGFTATEKIKARHPKIVIIALTANVLVETKEKVFACGCDDFIHKPCSRAELLAKMQQYLKIEYSYSRERPILEPEAPARTSLPPIALDAAMLKVMSPQWIEQLHLAAIAAKEKQILALIQEIPASASLLAQILTNSLELFRLEEIINCTAAFLK
jgi:signal transduction histidine kinase/DNA-binding response OmpR family regulator/PAS domain-containing protein